MQHLVVVVAVVVVVVVVVLVVLVVVVVVVVVAAGVAVTRLNKLPRGWLPSLPNLRASPEDGGWSWVVWWGGLGGEEGGLRWSGGGLGGSGASNGNSLNLP